MKWLLRKFDEWFLGSIDYGLVHITAQEYFFYSWKKYFEVDEPFPKMMAVFLDVAICGDDGDYITLVAPQLSQPLEDVEYDPIAN